MKKIIHLIIFLLMGYFAYGQQLETYSQYMFNGLILNPAYAGSKESLSFTGAVRKQWIGVDGAPGTQSLSVHSPLTNTKIAIGGFIINENIGVESRQEINVVYSYRMFFSKGKLSLGILGGVSNFQATYSDLHLNDIDDPNFYDQTAWFNVPNFGMGVYWYTDNYYIGFSIPKLLYNYFLNKNEGVNYLYKNNYLLTGGFLNRINKDITLKPSALIKIISGGIVEADVNTNLYYKNVCFGISYRALTSLNVLFEMNIAKDFKMGYSFDVPKKNFRRASIWTHEISLNYVFKHRSIKSVSPRFF